MKYLRMKNIKKNYGKEYFLEFESRDVRKWISPYFVCFVDWYKKTLIFLFYFLFLLICYRKEWKLWQFSKTNSVRFSLIFLNVNNCKEGSNPYFSFFCTNQVLFVSSQQNPFHLLSEPANIGFYCLYNCKQTQSYKKIVCIILHHVYANSAFDRRFTKALTFHIEFIFFLVIKTYGISLTDTDLYFYPP